VADGQQFGYDLAFVGSFFTGAGEEAEAGQGAKLLQRAAKGCFGECFVAGTLVQMADGSMRPISQVQVGDQVLSRDPATGKDEAKTVTNTIERHAPSVVDVVLHDAKTGHDETLTCTPEHPLFVEGQGWVEAGSLGIGSSIVSRAGPAMKVTGLTWQKNKAQELTAGSSGSSFGGYTVYNLTVEGDHTFFVGTANGGTWVHNAGPCTWIKDPRISIRDSSRYFNSINDAFRYAIQKLGKGPLRGEDYGDPFKMRSKDQSIQFRYKPEDIAGDRTGPHVHLQYLDKDGISLRNIHLRW